ncbi:MAG TPA: hypothetical protein VKU41_13200 [Polyangiaceae bacterium]|nr:hypothetical protein [Polyangiaceae bacterium]
MSFETKQAAMRAPFLAGACVAVVTLSQCSSAPPPPCFGVGVGASLSISIVEAVGGPSDTSSTCRSGFDLSPGQVLEATVFASNNDGVEDQCNVGVAKIAPFSSPNGTWVWTPAGLAMGGFPEILDGLYVADNGSCRGSVQIQITVRGSDPFAPSVPGRAPSAVLGRAFTGSGGANCPASCGDGFNVTLTKS